MPPLQGFRIAPQRRRVVQTPRLPLAGRPEPAGAELSLPVPEQAAGTGERRAGPCKRWRRRRLRRQRASGGLYWGVTGRAAEGLWSSARWRAGGLAGGRANGRAGGRAGGRRRQNKVGTAAGGQFESSWEDEGLLLQSAWVWNLSVTPLASSQDRSKGDCAGRCWALRPVRRGEGWDGEVERGVSN